MTNGEKIKEIFGIKDEQINEGVMFVSVYDFDCPKDNLCGAHDFFKNWWNEEYKEPIAEALVSLGVYKQVAWERDIAIQQLHELGYEFGQKIEPTTKNDLGVDCISRADAIKAMQDKAKKLKNEDTINGLCGAVAILYEMPRVTSQPRKGHWKLVQRGKFIDVCCSNCEATRVKEAAYNYTIDELDKEDVKAIFKSDDMRYCPYCGSDNREVEE